MPANPTIVIVGAGIAGLLMAIMLEKAGMTRYIVIERSETLSALGSGIALGCMTYPALKQLGLMDDLRRISKPFAGTTFLNHDQSLIGNVDGTYINERHGDYNLVFSRPEFCAILLSKVPPHKIHWKRRVLNIFHSEADTTVQCSDGSVYKTDIVIGADGGNSSVRQSMYRNLCNNGVNVPASDMEGLRFDQHCVVGITNELNPSEYPILNESFSKMFTLLGQVDHSIWMMPIPGNRIAWALGGRNLIPPRTGKDENFKNSHWGPEAAGELCSRVQHLGCPFGGSIQDIISRTPKLRLSKVMLEDKEFETWYGDRTVLIGDACHKLIPFSGQGAIQSILDCVSLMNSLYDLPDGHNFTQADITKAFETYRRERAGAARTAVVTSRKIANMISYRGPFGELARRLFIRMPPWMIHKGSVLIFQNQPQLNFLPLIPYRGTAPIRPLKKSRKLEQERLAKEKNKKRSGTENQNIEPDDPTLPSHLMEMSPPVLSPPNHCDQQQQQQQQLRLQQQLKCQQYQQYQQSQLHDHRLPNNLMKMPPGAEYGRFHSIFNLDAMDGFHPSPPSSPSSSSYQPYVPPTFTATREKSVRRKMPSSSRQARLSEVPATIAPPPSPSPAAPQVHRISSSSTLRPLFPAPTLSSNPPLSLLAAASLEAVSSPPSLHSSSCSQDGGLTLVKDSMSSIVDISANSLTPLSVDEVDALVTGTNLVQVPGEREKARPRSRVTSAQIHVPLLHNPPVKPIPNLPTAEQGEERESINVVEGRENSRDTSILQNTTLVSGSVWGETAISGSQSTEQTKTLSTTFSTTPQQPLSISFPLTSSPSPSPLQIAASISIEPMFVTDRRHTVSQNMYSAIESTKSLDSGNSNDIQTTCESSSQSVIVTPEREENSRDRTMILKRGSSQLFSGNNHFKFNFLDHNTQNKINNNTSESVGNEANSNTSDSGDRHSTNSSSNQKNISHNNRTSISPPSWSRIKGWKGWLRENSDKNFKSLSEGVSSLPSSVSITSAITEPTPPTSVSTLSIPFMSRSSISRNNININTYFNNVDKPLPPSPRLATAPQPETVIVTTAVSTTDETTVAVSVSSDLPLLNTLVDAPDSGDDRVLRKQKNFNNGKNIQMPIMPAPVILHART